MGSIISQRKDGVIEVIDLFPFRVTMTLKCLARHGIPSDVILCVLEAMKMLYDVEILSEALASGWTTQSNGLRWQYNKEKKYDIIIHTRAYSINDNVEIPREFYAKSFRRQAKLLCLLCGKTEYSTYILHPIVLCVTTCLYEYEKKTGCHYWRPSFAFKQKILGYGDDKAQ